MNGNNNLKKGGYKNKENISDKDKKRVFYEFFRAKP